MVIGAAPICYECAHFRTNREEGLVCKAFPKGIPDAVLFQGSDHKEPLEGDHGIQFEEKNSN